MHFKGFKLKRQEKKFLVITVRNILDEIYLMGASVGASEFKGRSTEEESASQVPVE